MKLKYVLCIACCSVVLVSCDLVGPLGKLDQEYVLTDANAITNKATAEGALAGIYSIWQGFNVGSFQDLMFVRSGMMADTEHEGSVDFRLNVIDSDNLKSKNIYISLYNVIANANSFINNISKMKLTDMAEKQRVEMIGEAYFHKALAEMTLLRLFGEFYDMKSVYGIVLWDEPIRSNIAKARSSVKESYEHILSCLEKAEVVDASVNYRANIYAVKALKARIYLDMQNYQEASKMATEVMKLKTLETDYLDCFRKPTESDEILYTLLCSYPSSTLVGPSYSFYKKPGLLLTVLADTLGVGGKDPRYTKVLDENRQEGVNQNNKYLFKEGNVGQTNTHYFIRLAEVCLIKAEAEARMKNYASAREALKLVTDRAGYDANYVDTISDTSLIEKILEHKYMELFMENYEAWFDMVRYYKLEGKMLLNFANLASGKTLILPIPRIAMSGNKLLVQNPQN